jgi:hypothetical protein
MKAIWISAMKKDEAAAQKMAAPFKTYGIEAQGHFWENDNAKMAWLGARDAILNDQIALWAILADREDLENGDLRYGLSMVALTIQAKSGPGFPIVVLQTDGDPLKTDELPTPLQRANILPAFDPGTPAKLVAKVHAKPPALPAAYHLDMVGSEQLGQWLEVYPAADPWPGIIFGVDDGEIAFQAVGRPGKLPKTSTLNYAMQGLKLESAGTQFTAWATQNEISVDSAYFVKISGSPKTLLFGPYAEDQEADMYIIRLQ